MEGSTNLTILYIKWWYGEGYTRLFKYIRAFYTYVTDLFSVSISIRTLFAPWKRDKISYEGLTLQQKFQVWTLNMSSRFIGFMIKVVTLAIYLAVIIIVSVFSVFLVLFWPIVPIAGIALVVLGVIKLIQ